MFTNGEYDSMEDLHSCLLLFLQLSVLRHSGALECLVTGETNFWCSNLKNRGTSYCYGRLIRLYNFFRYSEN